MAGMEAEADRCSSLFCQYIRRTVDRTGCCSLSLSATIVFNTRRDFLIHIHIGIGIFLFSCPYGEYFCLLCGW